MKIYKFILFSFVLNIFIPILGKSSLIWEKELKPFGNFENVSIDGKFFHCGDQYFAFYFGYMQDAEQDTVKQLHRYPALFSFNINGDLQFQKEERISFVDSNRKIGAPISNIVRDCKCVGDTLKADIPQEIGSEVSPNIYNFDISHGDLIRIDGVKPNFVQHNQKRKAIFTENELFAIGGWNPFDVSDLRHNRIDVHDIYGELLFRISFNMESFIDLVKENTPSGDFIYLDNNYFIAKYLSKDENTSILAKFKYDKEKGANALPAEVIPGELVWYNKFKPIGENRNIEDFKNLDNGDIISLITGRVVVKLNKNGEVIQNKILIDSKDENIKYVLNKFICLKKQGYTAHFGLLNDYKRRKFVILIANENLDVVEEIKWQYDNTDTNFTDVWNWVEDVKETDDGNLIVLGRNQYFPGNINRPYIAEIRPDYITGVKDEHIMENLLVSPLPATDFLNVSGIEIGENIEIYDLPGTKHLQTVYNGKIDISKLPAGVYFIQSGSKKAKFIKH